MVEASEHSGRSAELVRFSVAHPFRVLALWCVALLGFSAGLGVLRIDTSTSSFLDRTGPQWAAYQRSLEEYQGDEFIVVAVESPSDAPWDPGTIADVIRLSRKLERIDSVRRVDSIATVPLIRLEGGDVALNSVVDEDLPASDEGWQQLIERWKNDRIWRHSLISEDGRTFALNLLLDERIDADRAATVEAVRRAAAGLPTRITGVPVFRTAVNEQTRSEMLIFAPLTVLLLGLVVALFVPSAAGVLAPLLVGGVAAGSALGVMGALGVSVSLSTAILPSTLLALGSAYAMHMVTAPPGLYPSLARPIALSGLTTAIGFIAMATTRVEAIRELATYGALGVFIATLASLTLAPAILSLAPVGEGRGKLNDWLRQGLRRWLVGLLVRRRAALFAVWGAALIAAAVGIARLQIATDIILWFPHGSEIRDDYEAIRDRLSGITPVNILIESKGNSGEVVTEPRVLAAIDRLSEELEQLPLVGKSLSVADPLRLVHSAFSGDELDRLPSSRSEIEQYLVLLGGVDRIDDLLSFDYSHANILLRIDDNSSREIVELGSWVEDWWSRNGVPSHRVTTTGIMYEFGRSEEAIAYGQIRGLALASAVIALILFAVLRSPWVAFSSLVANLVPLAVGFGALGLAGVTLDAATVCLGSMALGIAVDDTIHVATTYREGREGGRSRQEALVSTLERVLPALVLTTLAICVGFLVLAGSGFTLIRNVGLVTPFLVSLCLLADLTLLPLLLLRRARADQGRLAEVDHK
ncbi:MAG: MMPL family transporter [Myxococcota bacterium]|nr:MMPL family transporter [Myxococcota bacterium]